MSRVSQAVYTAFSLRHFFLAFALGGTGLDMLRSFIKEKKGKIEIYSHDGYVLIDETQDLYRSAPTYFDGTLINITVQCDPIYYN